MIWFVPGMVAALAMMTLCAGCGRKEAKWHIGVSQPCSDEWRDKMNDEIKREALFHDSIAVEFRHADNDSRKQVEDINHFIEEKVDLIIVSPNEAQGLTPVIDEAYRKGISVVTFDRNVYGTCYTSHFEPDNDGIGLEAARYADMLFPGHVKALEIRGLEYSTPAQQRHEGFKRGADSIPGFRLVSVGGDWNGSRAKTITDSVLSIDPDINVIYAHNDGMAIAASKAAKARGRNDIKIIGTDAAPSPGLKALVNGEIDASFLYPTAGGRVFRSAVDILGGRHVPKEDRLAYGTVVNKEAAEILLRQNELLKEETAKVEMLKSANDSLGKSNRLQELYIWTMIVAVALLVLGMGLLLFYLRQRQRFSTILEEKQRQLEEEHENVLHLLRAQAVENENNLEERSEFYKKFMDILRAGMGDSEFGVEQAADRIGLSQTQLARKVKELTDVTPSEILRQMRLRKTHKLLLTTQMNISEISYECGFSSPAYFSKSFREAYGHSPKQFREKMRDVEAGIVNS